MEAVAEVASAKEKPLRGRVRVQCGEFRLRPHRIQSVDRMIVDGLIKDRGRINEILAIDRDKVIFLFRNILEGIHPVVGRGPARAHAIVPRGPGALCARHHGTVGVESGGVFLIPERREESRLVIGRVSEQGEGFIRMGGDDHAIEGERLAAVETDGGFGGRFAGFDNLRRKADWCESSEEFVAVGLRSTGNGEPVVVGRDAQESVVLEKPNEAERREVEHTGRIGGPDRRTHGEEVKIQEIFAKAVALGEFAHGAFEVRRSFQRPPCIAEEAKDLPDEAEEARVQDVPALGEEFVRAHAVVFQFRVVVAHAEGHLGRLGGNAEFLEEGDEVRVGDVVEDDEPSVDGYWPAILLDDHGIRMSAWTGVPLDEGYIRVVAELPSGAHAGDTRADDGDAFPHFVTADSGRVAFS